MGPDNHAALKLADRKPFGRGGKRDCYVHPAHPDRCVKVNRADRRPEDLLQQLPPWKRWRKTVRDVDENHQDWKTLAGLGATVEERVWRHVPRLHGWVETDLGRGLVVDLVRDADGLISRSFLAYIWENGFDDAACRAVDELVGFWEEGAIPSRSLGLHNMAARRDADGSLRLVVVDGLGSTEFFPLSFLLSSYARRRARRRAEAIRDDVRALLARKRRGVGPGPFGFLLTRT